MEAKSIPDDWLRVRAENTKLRAELTECQQRLAIAFAVIEGLCEKDKEGESPTTGDD